MTTDTTMTIEAAQLTDVDQLYEWGQNNSQLWMSETEHWFTKEQISHWITDPRQDIFLVARSSGKLAGFCMAYNLRDWAIISDLFVAPDFQGQGIGKTLLDTVVAQVKKQGIGFVALYVHTHNNMACGFYRKMGFETGNSSIWMYKRIEEKE